MPPHCDALDGPVVAAARAALEHEDVTLVLPYVPAAAETEVQGAWERTIKARAQGHEARDVADLWFFETVVRLHRAGEGAAYTGLKPAGLDVGPVIPVAETAIRDRDPEPLVELLVDIVSDETRHRFQEVLDREAESGGGGEAARRHVSAVLGLQVWAHRLAMTAHAPAHGDDHGAHA